MAITLQFLGGAGTVTGSKYLVSAGGRKMLVDCGLFQGLKELRLRNWAPFPVDPSTIDFVILTHAHLDHCGYVPLLVKNGFGGKVYATPPTRDLARLILADSARIQEEDAEFANKMGFSKHAPAKALYTTGDVHVAMTKFESVPNGDWLEIAPGVRFRYVPNGHILGSACVELDAEGRRIVFSGDMGRRVPLILQPPKPIEEADELLLESTYGDRDHPHTSPADALARVINETHDRGGHLIIPSFAVGRAQDLLYLIWKLKQESRIPEMPVFLDSPLGVQATEVLAENAKWHRLSEAEVHGVCGVATLVRSQQQSEEITRLKRQSIVIAGSGMITGGRVLHHLAQRLTDPRSTILLVGYQAVGTRGRALREGATELKFHGGYTPVRARVEEISSLSAHADQSELLEWLKGFKRPPKRVTLVHGEPQAAEALLLKIRHHFGWDVHVAHLMETRTLG